MSIATELARLRRAKNEIKEAIEDKGVDVPNDKRLDDYDDYVKMIRAATDPLEWGKIIGNIEDQEDLMELLSSLVHYEIYADLSEITDPRSSILYLIGPSGDGEDEYEEYVYVDGEFVKIGEASIDLSGKQDVIDDLADIRSGAAAGATAYQKPSGGIPSSDMASAVQTSLGKADSAYQKPNTGIPSSDMASAVQTSLGKADSAYQKPSGGVPKSDLASGVQDSLDLADSAVQAEPIGSIIPPVDPSEFATKEEVDELDQDVTNLAQETLGFNDDMTINVVAGTGQNTGSNPAYLTNKLCAGVTYRIVAVGTALQRITPRLRSSANAEVSATWVNVETSATSTAAEKAIDIGAAYDITPSQDVTRIGIYYTDTSAVGTGTVTLQIRNPSPSLAERLDNLESEIDGIPEELATLQKKVAFYSNGMTKDVIYTNTSIGLPKTDGTIDASVSTRRTSPYIPFEGDLIVYNAFTGSATAYAQVAFYDENYVCIAYRRGTGNVTDASVTLNKADYPNAAYIRYGLPNSTTVCKATMPASVVDMLKKYAFSPNYGKTVSLFGASFSSEHSGYYAYAALNKWRESLALTITNYSTPGAGFTPDASSLIQTQVDTACADAVQATDIYIIWASANDFAEQGAIGINSDYTIDDNYNVAHLSTFCGGLNYCIKKILTKAPTAKIILLTSLRNGHLDSGRNPYSTGSGNNLAKYVDAEKECCYRYGVPYFDQYAMFPMNEFTKDYYLQEDGRHPNVVCYERLADMQIPFLASI